MPAERPKKNAERLNVLEEFGFTMATPEALALAAALIEARKDAARLAWIKSQLERGKNVDFTRDLAELEDDTTGLCISVYLYDQAGPNERCGKFVAGNTDFHDAIDDARRKLENEPQRQET